MIEIPERLAGLVVVVSVSGGKDSAACVLALREAGVEARYVFANTGWEAPETYAHLEIMERTLGITIARVGRPGGMREAIRRRAGFPARMQRWCTRELKVDPLREHHDALAEELGAETCSVVGIRAEESQARAGAEVFGFDDRWGGYVWRPLLRWSVSEVLAIHHRHGLPVNALYQRGHDRVGCWPGMYSSKEQIRLWAEHDPASVAEVAELERWAENERERRNVETPGRYAHGITSFFQSRTEVRREGRRVFLPMHVDELVAWASTAHGGRQGVLIREAPDSGCFRWGLCDPPSVEPTPED